MEIYPLLDFLIEGEPRAECMWKDWRITRITGGWNNLLYRATNDAHDLAIKFTRRDTRDRAGREFVALTALRETGLQIAPEPVMLAQNRYALPVVVQTWVAGEVSAAPPANDAEWMRLLEHYAAIHTLTPNKTVLDLPEAVVTMRSAEEGVSRVRDQLAWLPDHARPESLIALLAQFEQLEFPIWDKPRETFCRVDPNITNFLRRSDAWWSVDWENAGWGDPAFEIADLIVHPAYRDVKESRWDWVITHYCRRMNDAPMQVRIRAYRRIMLVWWVVRCARYLYDIPRGQDRRLAAYPAEWQADFQAKYAHYLNLAIQAMP